MYSIVNIHIFFPFRNQFLCEKKYFNAHLLRIKINNEILSTKSQPIFSPMQLLSRSYGI